MMIEGRTSPLSGMQSVPVRPHSHGGGCDSEFPGASINSRSPPARVNYAAALDPLGCGGGFLFGRVVRCPVNFSVRDREFGDQIPDGDAEQFPCFVGGLRHAQQHEVSRVQEVVSAFQGVSRERAAGSQKLVVASRWTASNSR